MIAFTSLEDLGKAAGALTAIVAFLAVARKTQLKIIASPRFIRIREGAGKFVAAFQHPDGSKTQRLINSVKAEILEANDVSDLKLFARMDQLDERVDEMGRANDIQHAAVQVTIAGLTTELGNITTEVAEVKDRLEKVEQKLP